MNRDVASTFAKRLLEDHQDVSLFEVDFVDQAETEIMASALEALSCRVTRDPFKPRLTIIPPRLENTRQEEP